MKKLVVFYTRTDTTKKVAELISERLKADSEQVLDVKSRKGIIGWIKSGKEAGSGSLPEIVETSKDPSKYGLVIIGTPVWAGTMASPIRTYLSENKGKLGKVRVAFFSTQGSDKEQRVFSDMEKLIGNTPVATLFVRSREVKQEEFREKTELFARKITN